MITKKLQPKKKLVNQINERNILRILRIHCMNIKDEDLTLTLYGNIVGRLERGRYVRCIHA